jgi:hypothetical protein
MLEMVLGFPDEHLRANAERVNRLGEQVGFGPIVKETGEIVRPTAVEVQQQQLKTLVDLQKRTQEMIKEDPTFATVAALLQVGVKPSDLFAYMYGEEKERLGIEAKKQEIEHRKEEHPLEMEYKRAQTEKDIALAAEARAREALLMAQKDAVFSKGEEVGNVKTFNMKWTDPETGEIRQGVGIFYPKTGKLEIRALDVIEQVDEQGNVKQVRVRSPEVQKEWEKIKQDAGKVWGRYVKEVLKGRDLDWTDQKEVKRFQDYLQASGFITKMEKIPKGKKAIYSIIIIDPSDPKGERPIHGFPSEAAEVTRTKMSLPEMINDVLNIFGIGRQ